MPEAQHLCYSKGHPVSPHLCLVLWRVTLKGLVAFPFREENMPAAENTFPLHGKMNLFYEILFIEEKKI